MEIGKFYAMADFLVLPSKMETWGLVVNEALCFSLPVIVSNQVGAGQDLVIPEKNGYIFPVDNISALADSMSKLCEMTNEDRSNMGVISHTLITNWANRDIATPLVKYLESLYSQDE